MKSLGRKPFRNMRNPLWFFVPILLLVVANCATNRPPAWFLSLPSATGHEYIVADAVGSGEESALLAAEKLAQTQTIELAELRIRRLLTQLLQDAGVQEWPELTTLCHEAAVDAAHAAQVSDKKVVRQKDHFHAYVLIELPTEFEKASLAKQLSEYASLPPPLSQSFRFREFMEVEALKLLNAIVQASFSDGFTMLVSRAVPVHFHQQLDAKVHQAALESWLAGSQIAYTYHLTSVIKPDSPRKYVKAKTGGYGREPLSEVETRLLKRLEEGEKLAYTTDERMTVGLGDVRIQSSCLDCHTGQPGELLGAFAYTVRLPQSRSF